MGNACAGHNKLNPSLSFTLTLFKSSPALIFGLTLPTGSLLNEKKRTHETFLKTFAEDVGIEIALILKNHSPKYCHRKSLCRTQQTQTFIWFGFDVIKIITSTNFRADTANRLRNVGIARTTKYSHRKRFCRT
jgi:hypothetical protein